MKSSNLTRDDVSFYTYMTDALSQMLMRTNRGTIEAVERTIKEHINSLMEMSKEHPGDSVSFAYATHKIMDHFNQKMLEESAKEGHIPSCKAGCGFCCYQKVDITKEEAILIKTFMIEQDINLDQDVLNKQALAENAKEYMKLPLAERKCVFLQNDMSCGIYEHRPNSCRAMFSVSEPNLCDTEENPGGKITRLNSFPPEAFLVATHMQTSDSNGLAEMLLTYEHQKDAVE